MSKVIVKKSENLFGHINLSGAKNAALPIMVAACLCSNDVTLNNMPVELNDVKVMISVLKEVGFDIEVVDHSIIYHNSKVNNISSCVSEDASKIRYSLLLLPILLIKTGECHLPKPGGCNLGDRKYDIHLDSLKKMNAIIEDREDEIYGLAANQKLNGAELVFHIATTSGSESAVIAASLANGKTIIKNANTRPEVIDLIRFLNSVGAQIKYNTRYIEINGVNELSGGEYTIIKDSHEAVSYMILAGMTKSEISINNFNLDFIREDVNLLREIGIEIFEWGNNVYVSAKEKNLKPFSMATAPYPGINSDMQPLLAALACTIEGESIVTDTRFTERFQYVDEFLKFGIDIVNYENCAIIHGGKTFQGSSVYATDLRAGAALTFLGICAEGETIIDNYYQTQRGYVDICKKLKTLGVDISSEI